MLLAYVGMSADMLDFLREGIENEQVQCEVVSIVILLVFSLSLFQFPIGLNLFIDKKNAAETREQTWTIFATMIMQDGPFLAVRLYLLTNPQMDNSVKDSTDRIFFAIKNALVLLLQMYRLCILWNSRHGRGNMSPIIQDESRNEELDMMSLPPMHHNVATIIIDIDNDLCNYCNGTNTQQDYYFENNIAVE